MKLAAPVRHGCRSAGLACPLGSSTAAGSSVRHNQGLKARPHALNRFISRKIKAEIFSFETGADCRN
jgi:hypothetical protein